MKLALVTGAAGGLGRAVCVELSGRGFAIAAADLVREDQLRQTLESVGVRPELAIGGIDLASPADIAALLSRLPTGRWTVLVNNAGISLGGRLADGSLEDWNKMLGVNLTAPFLLSQAFVNNAQANNLRGSIINISSLAGIAGAKKPGYAASKAGLIGLTKAVAMQAGPLVRCNAIYPGAMNTPMTSDWDEATRLKIAANTPVGRIAEPSEIAKLIGFLADDQESGFLSGAVVNATGGQYLGQ